MDQKCKQCGENFEISKEDEKYFSVHGISVPHYCRLCSWQRKLAWQNEYQVYKRKCDATGKTMISVYKDGTSFPVYEKEYWSSDKWELPKMTYDKSRPFFEQYWELFEKVPRPSTNRVGAENSEYAHLIFDSKSCYLSFQVFQSERLIGCYRAIRLKDCANCFFCIESELLCECTNVSKGYNLKFCENCEDCSDSAFLYDCKGCRNCFMCSNLRNKLYHFKNKKFSKEEYEKKIAQYDLSMTEGQKRAKREFEASRDKFIVKASHTISCENCFGDYLVGCKNCQEIYFSDGCQDSKYILRGTEDITSYDCVVGGKTELCYNIVQPGWCYKCALMQNCNHCNEVYLSESCDDCNQCIGCISLKRGKNCILNKQYSEGQYRELKEHIFGELKKENSFEEIFDMAKSPFVYEETIADLYFPRVLSKNEAVSSSGDQCAYCSRQLSFTEAEKKFYEKMGLALPDDCFYCRILRLARPYSVVRMSKANCSNCGKEIFVGKNAKISGKLYCEECYLKEIY